VRRLVNSVAAIVDDVLQRLDRMLRTWATAGVLLMILALVLAAAMLVAR
jgi:muramoyltetrapeptide carboxypeptidase LdcA involved in peptidoglycan recycling